jgi:hypothetical protein
MNLTLAQKAALREWLTVIIPPSSQVGVRVCLNIPRDVLATALKKHLKNILIDICFCWEIHRIATYVDGTFGLIDSNVVDMHGSGKSKMRKIYKTEILRHSQIQNNVL